MTINSKKPHKRPWQDIAHEAQDLRDKSIEKLEPGLPDVPDDLPKNVMDIPAQALSKREIYITTLPVETLLAKLNDNGSDRLSSFEVCHAFLQRAGLAQRLTNCITELLPDEALARASELDAHFERTGKPIGPLHGLPISVKEHIGLANHHLHASFIALWPKIAHNDAHIIQILRNAGAIPFARTTQPQTIMHLETDSNFYGTTVNPYNRDLTSGGSSGGEGALIGLRGSCLGIGTDVGGSIRSPAANSGIWGFKPTTFRLPTDGWSAGPANVDEIPTAIGPLSTSLAGLSIFLSTILAAQPWLREPALLPLPWTPTFNPDARKLRIAIMTHDDVVLPHPPVTRALHTLASKLATHPNIEIIPWKPLHHAEGWRITTTLYYPDGGAEDLGMMRKSGEPILPLTKWMIVDNPYVKDLTSTQLTRWKTKREDFRKAYAEHWNATADEEQGKEMVDAILCPVGPGCAPRHGTAKYWSYTSVWNLLDYPALVFPVLKAEKGKDGKAREVEIMGQQDRENWELYDPDTFDGCPVNLQLVGRRYEDEKVLEIAKYLQQEIELPLEPFP